MHCLVACSIDTHGLGAVRGDAGSRDAGPTTSDAGAHDAPPAGEDGGGPADGGFDPCTDAPIPDTFTLCPFGMPTAVFPDDDTYDDDPTFTNDLLELYFNRNNEIWVSKRVSPAAPWGAPFPITEIDAGPFADTSPRISGDGLTLWFSSTRPPSEDYDIWVTTRLDRTAASTWRAPTRAPGLSTAQRDVTAVFTRDGLQAIVSRRDLPDDATWSMFLYRRDATSTLWMMTTGTIVEELDDGGHEANGQFVPTDLVFFFDTDFGAGDRDFAVTTRPTPDSPFTEPVRLDSLSHDSAHDEDLWLSEDLRYAVFSSDRDDTTRIYEARR